MSEFEENHPEQLKLFLRKLNDLVDEFHPNIYLLNGVFKGVREIEVAISDELNSLNKNTPTQVEEVWLVLSEEGVVMKVCSDEPQAKYWRDNAFLGYYKDCSIKRHTEDIEHWMEKISNDTLSQVINK
jgi:hypothetical protein